MKVIRTRSRRLVGPFWAFSLVLSPQTLPPEVERRTCRRSFDGLLLRRGDLLTGGLSDSFGRPLALLLSMEDLGRGLKVRSFSADAREGLP